MEALEPGKLSHLNPTGFREGEWMAACKAKILEEWKMPWQQVYSQLNPPNNVSSCVPNILRILASLSCILDKDTAIHLMKQVIAERVEAAVSMNITDIRRFGTLHSIDWANIICRLAQESTPMFTPDQYRELEAACKFRSRWFMSRIVDISLTTQ